jgi:small conductance mechanosensitive channel
MNLDTTLQMLQTNVLPLVLRLLAAVAIWMIGRKVIHFVVGIGAKALGRQSFDSTLIRYFTSIMEGILTLFLVLGVVEFLGIPTTSFAALAAGAGLAIGAAWSGMLANFAAGIFIILMRPYKVGDHISGGGVDGIVREIGLFTTTFDTIDNVYTIVGNARLFGENIYNYSANAYRLCIIEFQLAHGVDFRGKMDQLRAELAAVPNVPAGSPVVIDVDRFTVWGPVMVAKVQVHADNFIRVKADVAQVIQRVFGDMGLAGHMMIRE